MDLFSANTNAGDVLLLGREGLTMVIFINDSLVAWRFFLFSCASWRQVEG